MIRINILCKSLRSILSSQREIFENHSGISIRKTIKAPPIKIQGIKTKLVRFIAENVKWTGNGRWIEPFLGSGVVLFNMAPDKALAAESNVHIIQLYKAIQENKMNGKSVRMFLESEGQKLQEQGESYYYEVRERFNQNQDSFDFLFLNRACFNGMMRFNSKGEFNVPFCKKPNRFAKPYVTKITNQIEWARSLISARSKWIFEAKDWRQTVSQAGRDDFIYLDPPYYGRHTDYYDAWNEQQMQELAKFLANTECRFMLSLWYENKYRKNDDIQRYFAGFEIAKCEHFYHIGPTESLRNKMTEALIINR